jgi:LysR family transcriptional regulator, nod-box dependent transcriptional activator
MKQFDLNLLVALDALLSVKNTTHAGRRINRSQPAMSSALARLREHFEDDLLTQVGRNLVPTPLGETLACQVRDILTRAEATLDSRSVFDPARAHRQFKLMMSDYVSTVLMSQVVRRAAEIAPGVGFDILPHEISPWESIEHGESELLIMPVEYLPADLPRELLFTEKYVCVTWRDNPKVGEGISAEQYLELGHVLSRPGNHPQRRISADERYFEYSGQPRRIEVVVSEFANIPFHLIGTTRVATMHGRLATLFARQLPLKILPLPLPVPDLHEATTWHPHRERDPGLRWLRELIKETAAQI